MLQLASEAQQQPGKDLAVGGAGLASTLIELGLVDEFRLFIARSCWAAARLSSRLWKSGSIWIWSS